MAQLVWIPENHFPNSLCVLKKKKIIHKAYLRADCLQQEGYLDTHEKQRSGRADKKHPTKPHTPATGLAVSRACLIGTGHWTPQASYKEERTKTT